MKNPHKYRWEESRVDHLILIAFEERDARRVERADALRTSSSEERLSEPVNLGEYLTNRITHSRVPLPEDRTDK